MSLQRLHGTVKSGHHRTRAVQWGSQESRGVHPRMLAAQSEHHRQESVLVEQTMVDCISYIFYSC